MTAPGRTIIAFSGAWRFLSNFAPSPIIVWGLGAPTVEHAFQAHKTRDRDEAMAILVAPTPREAKRLGRSCTLRPDWEAARLDVMRGLLELKFPAADVPPTRQLLATGDAVLVEGNTWGDRYWGRVDGQGHNWLGHLLMARRAELRS